MKSAVCSAAGLNQPKNSHKKNKKIRLIRYLADWAYFLKSEERLREESRGRAIVGVGIADPVGVELDLAVVEVEVRRVVEVAIGIRKIALCQSMCTEN